MDITPRLRAKVYAEVARLGDEAAAIQREMYRVPLKGDVEPHRRWQRLSEVRDHILTRKNTLLDVLVWIDNPHPPYLPEVE